MNHPASTPARTPRFAGSAAGKDAPVFQCRGVKLVPFPLIPDPRGNLMFAEFPKHLPFVPKRIFATFDVPAGSVRGEHAHRKLEQLIICLVIGLLVTGLVVKYYRAAHPADVGQRGLIFALRNGQALAHQSGQTSADAVAELAVARGVRAGALVRVDRAGGRRQAVPTRGRIHLVNLHAARAQALGSHAKGALHGLFGVDPEARGAL